PSQAATFRYSIDGGNNWIGPIQVKEREYVSLIFGVQITFDKKFGYSPGARWTFTFNYTNFKSNRYSRWASKPWQEGHFFINRDNALRYTNGRQVYHFHNGVNALPAGSYLEEFYQHIIIGKPVI